MYKFHPKDLNIYNEYGHSTLYYGCFFNNSKLCYELLKRGANVNMICNKNDGNYPLHLALKGGNIELIMLLVEYGGNLNALNKENHTPIAFGSQKILNRLNLSQATCSR